MTEHDHQVVPQVSAADLRELIARLDSSRAEQPARITQARAEAETARRDALSTEPWDQLLSALPAYSFDGQLTGMMAIPRVFGKELFGTRLAFDLLGCCDDEDQVADILRNYRSMIKEPDHLFLIAFSALSVIANHVVPRLLGVIEDTASDWETRVTLAGAARNAWASRVNDIRSYGTDTTS